MDGCRHAEPSVQLSEGETAMGSMRRPGIVLRAACASVGDLPPMTAAHSTEKTQPEVPDAFKNHRVLRGFSGGAEQRGGGGTSGAGRS
jgi:hypothetical protein